jgi:hypothetical protein
MNSTGSEPTSAAHGYIQHKERYLKRLNRIEAQRKITEASEAVARLFRS